jgi:hypothetical protein
MDPYGVFVGLDVGKSEHHAVGLDSTGRRLHDAPLPNSEPKLRAMFDKLAAHDLAGEATRISNRIRGLLTGIHPAPERVLGPKATHPAVQEILIGCGGPTGIRATSHRKLTVTATKHAPRMDAKLVDDILAALNEQTVIVPDTNAADTVPPRLAESLKTVLAQRKTVAAEVEEILDTHPLGADPDLDARHRHQNRSPHPPRDRRHLRPQKAPVNSPPTPASHPSPTSRAYYDRERAEGKKHNAALICLPRHRCDVLFTMLRTNTHYQPPTLRAI